MTLPLLRCSFPTSMALGAREGLCTTDFKVSKWEVPIFRSLSTQWDALREKEERGPTRVKATPWANTELLSDSLFSRGKGFWVLLPLHSTYFQSIPPSFPAKASGFFWTPEQTPGSDSRAVDLVSLANLGNIRQGWWDLGEGRPYSLEKHPQSRWNAFRAFLVPPFCL